MGNDNQAAPLQCDQSRNGLFQLTHIRGPDKKYRVDKMGTLGEILLWTSPGPETTMAFYVATSASLYAGSRRKVFNFRFCKLFPADLSALLIFLKIMGTAPGVFMGIVRLRGLAIPPRFATAQDVDSHRRTGALIQRVSGDFSRLSRHDKTANVEFCRSAPTVGQRVLALRSPHSDDGNFPSEVVVLGGRSSYPASLGYQAGWLPKG